MDAHCKNSRNERRQKNKSKGGKFFQYSSKHVRQMENKSVSTAKSKSPGAK